MPNHVKNKVKFECGEEKMNEILTAIQYDPKPDEEDYTGLGTIDFNKLIPMPESLKIESGSETDRAIELFLTAINPKTKNLGVAKVLPETFEALSNDIQKERMFGSYRTELTDEEIQKAVEYSSMEKLIKIGEKAVTNFAKYGATTWYEWSIACWGTKWNSYDPFKGVENGLEFSTAWSAPHPIIEELTNRFPGVYITHEWADEDIGSNCGRREYLNGECVGNYVPETEKEALEFATSVWDETPDDYGMILSRDGEHYVNERNSYEFILLFGKPALFTSERLNDSDIPNGLYVYHVRGDDETTGGFAELAPRVLVNHFGSIVTKDPIDFGQDGFITFTPETEPKFVGVDCTFRELIDDAYPTESEVTSELTM